MHKIETISKVENPASAGVSTLGSSVVGGAGVSSAAGAAGVGSAAAAGAACGLLWKSKGTKPLTLSFQSGFTMFYQAWHVHTLCNGSLYLRFWSLQEIDTCKEKFQCNYLLSQLSD